MYGKIRLLQNDNGVLQHIQYGLGASREQHSNEIDIYPGPVSIRFFEKTDGDFVENARTVQPICCMRNGENKRPPLASKTG